MAGRRERKRQESTVPTDSVSDIAFLLIIFFILTTSIRRFTGFRSDIPAAERAEQTQTEKMPSVRLRGTELTLNDQAISIDALREKLTAMRLPAKPEGERVIVLEATGSVPYQRYFEVMSAISGASGVVGMLSEEKETKR